MYGERYMVGNTVIRFDSFLAAALPAVHRMHGAVGVLYFSIVFPSFVPFSTTTPPSDHVKTRIETGRDSDLRLKLFIAARLSFGYRFVAPEFICVLVSNFSQLVDSSKVAQVALFALFLK